MLIIIEEDFGIASTWANPLELSFGMHFGSNNGFFYEYIAKR